MKKNRDHIDELKDAPKLSKLDRNGPFKAPESYFEGMDERFFEKLSESEDEGDEVEWLSALPKGEVFTTPEGYFDQVQEVIMNRMEQEEGHVSRASKFVSMRLGAYALTAVAAVVLLFMLFLNPEEASISDVPQEEWASLSNLPMEDLIAAVEPETLSEDMILSTFPEDGFSEWVVHIDQIESEERERRDDFDQVLESIDVYMLEDELDELGSWELDSLE